MTIIKIDPIDGLHPIESQSHRRKVWMDGYIAVPPQLETEVWATQGYCDLVIEDGVLTGITPLPIPEPPPDPAAEIAAKKAELTATDYQIIKCSEYQLAGMEPPYDIAALHSQRQALRDEINRLEAENE
jgi:hypothetical protein